MNHKHNNNHCDYFCQINYPGVLAMPNLAVGVFGILVFWGVYHQYFDVFECEQVVLATNVTSRECREFET